VTFQHAEDSSDRGMNAMKFSTFGRLWFVTAVLILTGAAVAGEALGTLEGTVIDSHGNPVAGASVFVQTSDGQHPHATKTDSQGRFEFERYSPGQYDLRASYLSVFTDWHKRVIVRAGKATHVTLQLPAAVK